MASEHIFNLVKSLSRTEKAYFKKYAYKNHQGKDSVYIKLYEAIDLQKEYDELLLKKKFKGEQLLKQFSVAKNYLESMIMKCLRDYHGENSFSAKLHTLLRDVDLLHARGLFYQCDKLLKRAWKLTDSLNKLDYKKEIIDRSLALVMQIQHSKKVNDQLSTLLSREKTLLKEFENIHHFRKWAFVLLQKIRKGGAMSDVDKKDIRDILQAPLLKKEFKHHSYEARNFFYMIHIISNRQLGKEMNAYKYSVQHVQYMESDSIRMKENPSVYITCLSNHTDICMQVKKTNEAFSSLQKLKEICRTSILKRNRKGIYLQAFLRAYCKELKILSGIGNYSKACQLIEQVKKDIDFYKISDRYIVVELYQQIVNTLFISADYKGVLFWIKSILAEDIKSLAAFYREINIINILVHYELGNTGMLNSLIRSMRRYLIKDGIKTSLESVLINFFSEEIPYLNGTKEKQEAFILLKEKVVNIVRSDTACVFILDYFDLLSWIDSKIENRIFVEIVQKKAKIIMVQ